MIRATKAILYHCSQLHGQDYQTIVDGVKEAYREKEKQIEFYDHGSCPKTEEERHRYCPEGRESWCQWQKDKAAGTDEYDPEKSSTRLPHSFFHALRGIFDILSNDTLLRQCSDGYTQNAVNGCITVVVWFHYA